MSKLKALYFQAPDSTVPNITNNNDGSVTLAGALDTGSITSSGNITATGPGSIHGLTVGKGNNNIATNTTFGVSALADNTIGVENTAVGNLALTDNTAGAHNSAFGSQALLTNSLGANNTAIGKAACRSVFGGSLNTAVGANALFSATSGSQNTAVGANAAYSVSNGTGNVAVGNNALTAGAGMSGEVAVGDSALAAVASSNGQNVAVGRDALAVSTRSVENIAIGGHGVNTIANAGTATMSASSVATTSALGALTFGYSNIAVGNSAGSTITTGHNNIMIGQRVGAALGATPSRNVFIGNSLNTILGSPTQKLAIESGANGAGTPEAALLYGDFSERYLTSYSQTNGQQIIDISNWFSLRETGTAISTTAANPFASVTNAGLVNPQLEAFMIYEFEYWLMLANSGTGIITLGWGGTVGTVDLFRAEVKVLPAASGTAYAGVNPYTSIANKALTGGNSAATHDIRIKGLIRLSVAAPGSLGLRASVASGTITLQTGSYFKLTNRNRYNVGVFTA